MKKALIAVCAAISLAPAAILAADDVDKDEPIELTAVQMDQITAGDLTLPNGDQVFAGFDNAAPGPLHPGLYHLLFGPASGHTHSEAAWEAHANSDQISCADCGG